MIFDDPFSKLVQARFGQSAISIDGIEILLKAGNKNLRLVGAISSRLRDVRKPDKLLSAIGDLVLQRVPGNVCGYEVKL